MKSSMNTFFIVLQQYDFLIGLNEWVSLLCWQKRYHFLPLFLTSETCAAIISSNSTVCLPLPLCSRFLLVRMSKLHFILRNVTNNFGSWVVWQFCLTDNFLNLPSTKYISARVVGMMVIAKVEKTLTYFRSFDEERPTALWHASYLRSRFKRQFPFSSLIQCLTIDIIADSICFQKASRGS